jgi:hypothetical protein
MSIPRRRLIRPAPLPSPDRQRNQQIQKVRDSLDKERTALARWMRRLKRAFNAVDRQQARVARLERKLSHMEEP